MTDAAALTGSEAGQGRSRPEDVLEQLARIDLVRALPAEEILPLLPFVRRMTVPRGSRVIEQGAEGDALYLLDQGSARVILDGKVELGTKGPGSVFGEMALLTGERRTATVEALTDLTLWRVARDDFARVAEASPRLREALAAVAAEHRASQLAARGNEAMERRAWRARALRALSARRRGLLSWQGVMAFGFLLVAALRVNDRIGLIDPETSAMTLAFVELVAGLSILQGACEGFILGVERLGARLRWDGFISGTIGSLVATLPEFVVIAFLVAVEPLAAFVTAAVTIFNNALAFSLYSFFLPKDQKGQFVMPRSLAKAGGEVLVVGSGVAMIIGIIMVTRLGRSEAPALDGADLLVVGVVMIAIYAWYTFTLVRYYGEGGDDATTAPPDPHELGHATSTRSIAAMLGLGVVGAYFGGEAIGGFADVALNRLGLPTIPTAALLAFFAGISEYIIVWKAHRRGELGIALSNAFGGMTQVMFMLLPFAMLVIGILGIATGDPLYTVPINTQTALLIVLLFPLFYVLLQFIRDDHTLNNLDAASMTGIYVLLLYFLFTT